MNRRRFQQTLYNFETILDADIAALKFPALSAAVAALNVTTPGTVVQKFNGRGDCQLTLAACPITVTDALAYASLKLLDFAEGRIAVTSSLASLQFGVTTTRSSTINDSASMTWALGTVAASNITLSSTMVDLLPKTTIVLSAATTALNAASTGALAAAAQFDGTATAKVAYLNVGFETNTDIDGDAGITATGTITIISRWLGDY